MACYQSVSLIHGGPRVQILRTKSELEKLGVDVSLFQPWESRSQFHPDIFHLYSANLGTFHLARNIVPLSIPLVTSPIFFTQRSAPFVRLALSLEHSLKYIRAGIWTDYGFTEQICKWSRAVLPNTVDESRLIEHGLNIQEFVTKFNAKPQDQRGDVLPVIINVYEGRTYDFITKKPPASNLIKKMLKIESGAHNALKENVGTLTDAQLTEIAKTKMPDLNTTDIEAAKRIIAGTARQMGVNIK